MESSLRERLARLGRIRSVDQVPSGSPAVVVLRLPRDRAAPRTVDAVLSLVRRGVPMLRAKRAIEALLVSGRAFVQLPTVESREALINELHDAGIRAAAVDAAPVDVRALRTRLGMTREQFATHYGLDPDTLRNWEAGRREPDQTARSYLRAIANDPTRVEEAYAPTPS